MSTTGRLLPIRPPWWSARPDLTLGWGGHLDEIAAGVVEHGGRDWAHLGRLLGEANAESLEPFELGPYVLDREGGERNAVGNQRFLEWLGRGVPVGLEEQLGSVWIFR